MAFFKTFEETQEYTDKLKTGQLPGLQEARQFVTQTQPVPEYGVLPMLKNLGGGIVEGLRRAVVTPLAGLAEGANTASILMQRPGGLFGEDYYNSLVQNVARKQKTGETLTNEEQKALQFENYLTSRINEQTGELAPTVMSQEDFRRYGQGPAYLTGIKQALETGSLLAPGIGVGGKLATGIGGRVIGGTGGRVASILSQSALPGAMSGIGSTRPNATAGEVLQSGGIGAGVGLLAYGAGSAIGKAGRGIKKISGKVKPTTSKNLTGSLDIETNIRQSVGERYGYADYKKQLENKLQQKNIEKGISISQTIPTKSLLERNPENPLKLFTPKGSRMLSNLDETTNDFFDAIGETPTTTTPFKELQRKAEMIYKDIFGDQKKGTIGALTDIVDQYPTAVRPIDKKDLIGKINQEFADNLAIQKNVNVEKVLPKVFSKINTKLDDAFNSENPLKSLIELRGKLTDVIKSAYSKGQPSLAPEKEQFEVSIERALRNFITEKAPTDVAEMYKQASAINAVTKNSGFAQAVRDEVTKLPAGEKQTITKTFKTKNDILKEIQQIDEKWEKTTQNELQALKIKLPLGAEIDPVTGLKIMRSIGRPVGAFKKGLRSATGAVTMPIQKAIPGMLGGSYIRSIPNIYDQQVDEFDRLESLLNQPNIDYNTYTEILNEYTRLANLQADVAEATMEEQQQNPLSGEELIQYANETGISLDNVDTQGIYTI